MSFKSVQKKIAKGGIGMERAGAMLASRTRKTMQAHGMSTKHGIPKGVFNKKAFKNGSKKTYLHGSGELMGHETVMNKVKAMGMMGDKHMMDAESMAKMKKQMPKGMMM